MQVGLAQGSIVKARRVLVAAAMHAGFVFAAAVLRAFAMRAGLVLARAVLIRAARRAGFVLRAVVLIAAAMNAEHVVPPLEERGSAAAWPRLVCFIKKSKGHSQAGPIILEMTTRQTALLQILLMIFLRAIKLRRGRDLGHQRAAKFSARLQFFF